MRIGLVIIAIVLIGAEALAGPPPRYRLDAARENVVEISRLDAAADCRRDKQPTRGRVVKREFDKSGLVPSSLVIELSNGDRQLVNVYPDLEEAPAVDKSWIIRGLQRLTREGAILSFYLNYCGAAGRVVMVDRISAR